uniref:Lipocalin n=1 Tax=Rhipicephalus appendiculatus TaxID=34631 RepID=A0A131Z222_RHIAP
MEGFVASAMVTLLLSPAFVVSRLGAPGGPLKFPREEFDVTKVFSWIEDLVSIADSDNDTILECLYAKRTEFNPETYETTITWFFPSQGTELPFYVYPGSGPGMVEFTSPGDPTPKEAIVYYTDYNNCLVADVEFHGHQCSLWVVRQLKDAVPQDCIDHFVDTCGVIVPEHSRDLCIDGEGDY